MSTFLNNFFPADTAAMDPIFYPPSNGIPSESKLATYMVTPQSPEFIPNRINSSPNFYTPYHTPMLSNGLGSAGVNVVGGVGPSVAKSVNSTPSSLLGLQKAAAAAVAQQKQLQQQHHHKLQQQSQQPTQPSHALVNGVISTTQPPTGTQSYVNMSTPMKVRGNMLHNESPTNLVSGGSEKSPTRITPHASPIPTTLPANVHQENVGGTIYFYPTANHTTAANNSAVVNNVDPVSAHHAPPSVVAPIPAVQPPLLYTGHHVYPGPASNLIALQPKTHLESAFFLPDEMRSEILARNEISNLMLDPADVAQNALPPEVDNYHSLYPLEPVQALHGKITILSSTYKATHSTTGIKYCLRRLHGFRLQSTKCMAVVEMWKKLQHSNVVQLREIFTTKAFGDNSLVLVYDYHPGSQTLLAKYFTPTQEPNGYPDPFQGDARPFSHKSNLQRTNNGPLLPEASIWSIIMQLTAGLRAIHQAGLACKVLDPTKVLVTGKRMRLSFCGTSDIAQFDPNAANPLAVASMHQQDDLTALGRLVLALACRCLQSVQRENVQNSIEMVSRHYSTDLRNFIVYLFSTTQRRSVTDLMPMIGARFYTQMDALQSLCDMQEDELAKEMENGRLYRILVKLNCINERPDFNMDCTWSETGDRYMLKLFRDYLFHSVTEDGRPWLDHAHIVNCLNKLDAGALERVQLMSRDEQSVLIVTYAELKNCLENAFSELVMNAPT
ncbi:PAN2-PAN3 deadenylation complex subunit PAN3 isoform X1 [Bactrocera dorsalis]|uniref:PAN2-PAN3 deadenylation complex subunit PAN3 n=3 Tax=Bactrocera dorsalis TaxID=27457 RepID=A0A034V5D0_BACDO|nr:PAN2-PAN3 deadenylation complex subunit PAN3 isoform X1 [Bactrocera dorsalis]XP_011210880.1 PAN2-PAN3 deadenylation complex subunit PAN3 isoform X1 [Bactrocera dorsalis]XP_011210883.1 PAN2-PAN3 deadenylation complex subunit PAN3 isoform X1 [Bactrocera dorsalis]XP_011210884.1 PAN2-PAN3 deadenylation complex subunit PAN3 isoform X1 [Bactrocera dorsalis]XP_019847694.1 PAN2-PAN3 deadenylation complex subunit PAN3 isoform X1 [Bactrocera dorsalis]XP_029408280.1 PAN2-PAN3 deadenylation complex sub